MEIDMIQLMKNLLEDTHGVEVCLHQSPYDNIQCFDGGLREHLYEDYHYADIIAYMESECKENTVYLLKDQFEIHHMIFKLPDYITGSTIAQYITVGPYTLENYENEVSDIIESIQLPIYFISELKEHYNSIPVVPQHDILQATIFSLAKFIFNRVDSYNIERRILSLHESIEDREYRIDFEDTLSMTAIEERYKYEDELLEAVEHGDSNRAIMRNFKKYRIEQRTTDSIRNGKNMLIVMNSLLRKAVQKADVHPAHIDKVATTFAKRIEASTNDNDLKKIYSEMIRKYCLLVQNNSLRGYSSIIQNLINYIEFNIAEPLSLKYLSEIVLLNPSYLSTRFKKEAGKNITDYINEKRIQKSLIYLATTDLPIQSIAEKVGIFDENYFSRLFKKIQKKTPTEYRNSVNGKGHN